MIISVIHANIILRQKYQRRNILVILKYNMCNFRFIQWVSSLLICPIFAFPFQGCSPFQSKEKNVRESQSKKQKAQIQCWYFFNAEHHCWYPGKWLELSLSCDFSGGLLRVSFHAPNAGGPRFDPWSGNQIPRACRH